MKSIKLRKYLQTVLLLIIPAMLWGCGGGGGSSTPAPTPPSTAASVTVVSSGNGVYTVQGNNLSGVAGMKITLSYDVASLSSPTVTQGGFIPGALFVANTDPTTPGTIIIAFVSTTAFSGSGQIATVTFATHTGTPTVTVNSVTMSDINGNPL